MKPPLALLKHLRPWLAALALVAISGGLGSRHLHPQNWRDWWLTPDQQGDWLLQRGQPKEAATRYRDPMRRGVALYRDGQFEAAASAFARLHTPEATYNQGNALLMGGKYDQAVSKYEETLKSRPGWQEAVENLALARLRAERVKSEGGIATGGQIKPDEIVYGPKSKNKNDGEKVTVGGDQPLTDSTLQEAWLQRIQTKPADFLRAKFSFQRARDTAAGQQP